MPKAISGNSRPTPMETLGSVDEALRRGAAALAATSPSPMIDAEVLVMHACKLDRTQLITQAEVALTPAQERQLHASLGRRRAGEPIAYIIGHKEFWSMCLRISPVALIPRPETELLVEQALYRIPLHADWSLVDLGTGCGAIALALARERRLCRVIATDQSREALDLARDNAARLDLQRIEFRHGEWLTPLASSSFHMIISNPPYVRAGDPHLERGDLRYEPKDALIGGADGLEAIRHIVKDAEKHLMQNGWLLLEHGMGQSAAVGRILAECGYHAVTSHRDLAGHDRVCAARRR